MRCWEPLWTTSHVHPVSFLSLMYVKYLFIKKMKDFQTNLALCDSHWHLSVGKGLQYKVISKALTLRWTTMTVIIYKWRRTWNSGEPRSDWPTKLLQESINDSFRRLKKKKPWKTTKYTIYLSFSQSSWFNNKNEIRQKWHPRYSSKVKIIAHQKEHKGWAHISQTSWDFWVPLPLE